MRTIILFLALSTIMFVGCSKEEIPNPESHYFNIKTQRISGLEDLGANARYEGWLIVPTTSNGDGQLRKKLFLQDCLL